MQLTLVYVNETSDGRGEHVLVKAFLHAVKARLWVESRKDPWGRTDNKWSDGGAGHSYYGAYYTATIDVDDSEPTPEELSQFERTMIKALLDTLSVPQRELLERHLSLSPRP